VKFHLGVSTAISSVALQIFRLYVKASIYLNITTLPDSGLDADTFKICSSHMVQPHLSLM